MRSLIAIDLGGTFIVAEYKTKVEHSNEFVLSNPVMIKVTNEGLVPVPILIYDYSNDNGEFILQGDKVFALTFHIPDVLEKTYRETIKQITVQAKGLVLADEKTMKNAVKNNEKTKVLKLEN